MRDPIGEAFGEVVASLRSVANGPPYYMYGHRRDVAKQLALRQKKNKACWPMVVLIIDTPEPGIGDVVSYNLNVVLLTLSKDAAKSNEDRVTDIIEPVLYPIYEALIQAIPASGLFMWPGDPMRPNHVKWDRPQYGIPNNEGSDGLIVSDPVDAIEIVNLALNMVICYDQNEYADIDPFVITDNDTLIVS